MFGLSPYLLGGAALAALLAFGGGYIQGGRTTANTYQVKIDKLQLDAADRLQRTRDAMQAQSNEAVAMLEKDNARSHTVFRTITQQVDKIIDRPVFHNVCLDDDGLRLANLALSGVATEAPAGPGAGPGMPQAGASH
jgi:hypothetical protein